jgi:uncharacterized membrane protein
LDGVREIRAIVPRGRGHEHRHGPTARAGWADFARGVSVVLMVMLHLCLLHYLWFFRG